MNWYNWIKKTNVISLINIIDNFVRSSAQFLFSFNTKLENIGTFKSN